MKKLLIIYLTIFGLSGCIGDDIVFDEVAESVRILNPVNAIAIGETYQFDAQFTNRIGQVETATVIWESSNPSALEINDSGLATAFQEGEVTVTASVDLDGATSVFDKNTFMVDDTTIINTITRSGNIQTTSSYLLQGAFSITENTDNTITITFSDDYKASEALPGLYVYLGNNPSIVTGAYEIGAVQVYNGAHEYIIENVGINEYDYLLYWCKPFNVKVGEGQIN